MLQRFLARQLTNQQVIEIKELAGTWEDGMWISLRFERNTLHILCPWRLQGSKGVLLGFLEDAPQIKQLRQYLLHETICAVLVEEPIGDLILEFSNSLALKTFSHPPSQMECWEFYDDSTGDSMQVFSDGDIHYTRDFAKFGEENSA